MELSPLAKEKLAKIGELTEDEKERLKFSNELTELLADYFTNKINADALWSKLKTQKESGNDLIIRETQMRLIGALNLGSKGIDFERNRKGILACETLKDEKNRYPEIELVLNSVAALRKQYLKEKEKTFNSMKASVQKQVEMAARQVAKQTGNKDVSIDIKGSVEASVLSSPQWAEFVLKNDTVYGQKFADHITKLKSLI